MWVMTMLIIIDEPPLWGDESLCTHNMFIVHAPVQPVTCWRMDKSSAAAAVLLLSIGEWLVVTLFPSSAPFSADIQIVREKSACHLNYNPVGGWLWGFYRKWPFRVTRIDVPFRDGLKCRPNDSLNFFHLNFYSTLWDLVNLILTLKGCLLENVHHTHMERRMRNSRIVRPLLLFIHIFSL